MKEIANGWATPRLNCVEEDLICHRRRVNPVEKIYASLPIFLYINPSYVRMLLEPLLEFQNSPIYTNGYAAPDLGTKPFQGCIELRLTFNRLGIPKCNWKYSAAHRGTRTWVVWYWSLHGFKGLDRICEHVDHGIRLRSLLWTGWSRGPIRELLHERVYRCDAHDTVHSTFFSKNGLNT
jgi:hypothetical protein